MPAPDDIPSPSIDFPAGAGEMAGRIRVHDWATTPLGPLADWPQSLRTCVDIMLSSPAPASVLWGKARVQLYNDAYITIAADRHPDALGRTVADIWGDAYASLLGPLLDRVHAGETVEIHEHRVPLRMSDGTVVDRFFSGSFIPVRDEAGRVAGAFHNLLEVTERLRSDAELRQREQQLARVLDQVPVGVGMFDAEGRFTLKNPQLRTMLGDTIPARDKAHFHHWDARDDAGRSIPSDQYPGARALRGEDASIPMDFRYRNGECERWLRVSAVPVRDPDGQPSGGVTVVQDITAKLKAEARYRLLFETIESGFCIVEVRLDAPRTDYRVVEANPAFFRQTGFPAEISGQWLREAAPDLEEHWYDLYGEVARTGTPARFEQQSAHLGRWFDVYAFRIGEAHEGRVAILFNDISARRHAEERLRELNETLERQVAERTAELRRYQDIIEATTSPICAFDTDFRLIAFNKAHNDEFRRVNGFDTKLGDIFPDLFIAEQQPVMRELMGRALSGESFTVREQFGRPELGQPFWEIHYTPLRDEHGAIVGAFHVAVDVSDRLRAEADLAAAQEALRQSQKMEAMGSLTGGVAHDFNNLLSPIIGGLDMLQRRGVGDERAQRMISGALASAERAKTLVQRLLAFARRQPLQPTAVDLRALVDGMSDLIDSTTGPQVKVVVDVAPDLPPARADINQIEMALLNLSVNARDAMPDGGTLTISAAEDSIAPGHRAKLAAGTYIRLSVTDTGIGMDAETLRRAVEPFYSTKGVGKGTGLGLSMVHGLAAQLGGGLHISSRPGHGTKVELWLPLAQAEAPTAERPVVEAPPAAGVALLVDDEELVRASTAEMLLDLGFEVVEAASADEALGMIENGLAPDILVTDHLMPNKTGAELARQVRDRVPVLVVSGYAEVDGIAPDLPRLTKPFRSADLAAAIAEVLPASE